MKTMPDLLPVAIDRSCGEDRVDGIIYLLENQGIPYKEITGPITKDALEGCGCAVLLNPKEITEKQKKDALIDFNKKGGGIIIEKYHTSMSEVNRWAESIEYDGEDLIEILYGGKIITASEIVVPITDMEVESSGMLSKEIRRITDFRFTIPLSELKYSHSVASAIASEQAKKFEFNTDGKYRHALATGVDESSLEENLNENILTSFDPTKKTSEIFLERNFEDFLSSNLECLQKACMGIMRSKGVLVKKSSAELLTDETDGILHRVLTSVGDRAFGYKSTFDPNLEKIRAGALIHLSLNYSCVGIVNSLYFGRSKNVLFLGDLLSDDLIGADTNLKANARLFLNALDLVCKTRDAAVAETKPEKASVVVEGEKEFRYRGTQIPLETLLFGDVLNSARAKKGDQWEYLSPAISDVINLAKKEGLDGKQEYKARMETLEKFYKELDETLEPTQHLTEIQQKMLDKAMAPLRGFVIVRTQRGIRKIIYRGAVDSEEK